MQNKAWCVLRLMDSHNHIMANAKKWTWQGNSNLKNQLSVDSGQSLTRNVFLDAEIAILADAAFP